MSQAAQPLETAPEAQAPQSAPPMAWHNFLCRRMLWLAAAAHLLQALWLLLGKAYYTREIRAAIYAGMPGMIAVDLGFAAALVAAAALQVLSALRLRARRRAGVSLLQAAYILLCAAMVGYGGLRLLVSGLSPLNPGLLGQLVAYAALLWMNTAYYRKRRSLLEPAEGEQ